MGGKDFKSEQEFYRKRRFGVVPKIQDTKEFETMEQTAASG